MNDKPRNSRVSIGIGVPLIQRSSSVGRLISLSLNMHTHACIIAKLLNESEFLREIV